MTTPVFLLAPPRSFTSVVNAMIGQHPELFGVPELNLFNFPRVTGLWQASSDQVGFNANRRHGLLRTLAEVLFAEQTDETILAASHWVAAREKWSTADIFAALRELVEPFGIVDKSPTYTMESERLYRIHDACPDARYIHLVRHPTKQCDSVMNLNHGAFALFVNALEYRDGRAHIEPQIAWHDVNVNIVRFLEDAIPPERYMRIRGESIMEHPKERLGEICRWLGIRDDDEAIDEMMHPERSPFACFGPITALFGNDPNFLQNPEFRQHKPKLPPLDAPVSWRDDGKGLFPEVIQMAEQFGYPLSSSQRERSAVMRPIGNISGSKSRQVESDPEKERMRLELRRAFREAKIQRKVQRHIGEITGGRPLFESVLDLLDEDGNTPANAPVAAIIKQQQSLAYQLKWLDAWALVFDKKLRSLDRERYWKERLAREHSAEKQRQELREEKGLRGIGEQDATGNLLLKSLEEAIQSSYKAASLRKYLDADDLDAPVLGIRRIESGLRCVFNEYIDQRFTTRLNADQQYELVCAQLTWIGVMAAEIHSKLTTVIEISEAALGLKTRPVESDTA